MNINNGDFYYVRLRQQTLSLGIVDLRPPKKQILTHTKHATTAALPLSKPHRDLLPPVQLHFSSPPPRKFLNFPPKKFSTPT